MKHPVLYSVASGLSLVILSAASVKSDERQPITLKEGPHLLIDDFLVARAEGVERKVIQPKRFLKEPLITGATGHQNWQPWLTVIHDPSWSAEKRFRMWYTADVIDDPADGAWQSQLAHLESTDGMHWPLPYRRLQRCDDILFGASVVDDGPSAAKPAERYKLLYYAHGNVSGPVVAFSPNGLEWTLQNGGEPVLPATGDSWHAGYDPIRKRYFLIGKMQGEYSWTNAEGKQVKEYIRRYGTSFSDDFVKWSPMKLIFSPDERDPGVTQWYACVGFQVRGDLLFGFLQVLRDDLTAEGAPKEAIDLNMGNVGAGMGHTVLAWTRDGETWHRDRQKDALLEPVAEVGAWDHAIAWVSSAAAVEDEMYLYYTGYRWGHKHRRSEERQVSLVKTKRDRYVARQAGPSIGLLVTPWITTDADRITLNCDASDGEIRVQVVDELDWMVYGLSFADCKPIKSDSLNAQG